MKLTENWQVKHVNYHSKKKAKLWLTVRIEDVNSYNPAIESNNHYIAMVEFNGKNEPVILWDNYARRRDKHDMEQMRDTVNSYLLINNNNPHAAYNGYIKDHLLSGKVLPYYVNGIKDFIAVSKDNKNNTYLQTVKRIEKKRNIDQEKQELLDSLTEEFYKDKILPAYKKLDVKEYQNTRMAIVGLWYAIVEKSINYINNSELGYIQEFLRNNNLMEINTN